MAVRKRLISSFPQGTRLCWTCLEEKQNFIDQFSPLKTPFKKKRKKKDYFKYFFNVLINQVPSDR